MLVNLTWQIESFTLVKTKDQAYFLFFFFFFRKYLDVILHDENLHPFCIRVFYYCCKACLPLCGLQQHCKAHFAVFSWAHQCAKFGHISQRNFFLKFKNSCFSLVTCYNLLSKDGKLKLFWEALNKFPNNPNSHHIMRRNNSEMLNTNPQRSLFCTIFYK